MGSECIGSIFKILAAIENFICCPAQRSKLGLQIRLKTILIAINRGLQINMNKKMVPIIYISAIYDQIQCVFGQTLHTIEINIKKELTNSFKTAPYSSTDTY